MSTQPKVLAFMQCMWVRDPEKVRRMMAAMAPERAETYRRRLVAYALFAGCKSGRVLRAALGDYCDAIVWEEATKEIGGHSSAVFPPDMAHIAARIAEENPDLIIAFGKVASDSVREVIREICPPMSFIAAPHPAARHATVAADLDEVKFHLDYLHATAPVQNL